MISAKTAKANYDNWLANAQKENKEYNRKRIAREKRESEALWKTRGVEWVAKIDAHIEQQSKNGSRHTYLPSRINPDGDLVIWLLKSDLPIHRKLMEYYRNNGFKVKEYSPIGMAIEW